MKCWIEVSSEYRFKQKKKGESGLYAPFSTRYYNMMQPLSLGDIIMHYIVAIGTVNNDFASSIVGISKTASDIENEGSRLIASLENIVILPIPIKLKEIKALENKSPKLEKLIIVNFQRYLTEITKGDSIKLIHIHPQNNQCMMSRGFHDFFKDNLVS